MTVLHVIHAINNSETISRLLFFIHGQTLCCFVCFPLCLEHPCNFALGLPLPVALEVTLDVIPMQLPTKMWLHGAGRWKFWNETAVLPLYRAVSPMKRFFVEHCPQTVSIVHSKCHFFGVSMLFHSHFFSTADLDTHPINRIPVWHDAMVFAPRWSL